jgi:hypothetical protein
MLPCAREVRICSIVTSQGFKKQNKNHGQSLCAITNTVSLQSCVKIVGEFLLFDPVLRVQKLHRSRHARRSFFLTQIVDKWTTEWIWLSCFSGTFVWHDITSFMFSHIRLADGALDRNGSKVMQSNYNMTGQVNFQPRCLSVLLFTTEPIIDRRLHFLCTIQQWVA